MTSFWWVTTGFLALGTRGDLLSVPTALHALFFELPLVVCLMAIQVPVPEPSRSVVLSPDLLVFWSFILLDLLNFWSVELLLSRAVFLLFFCSLILLFSYFTVLLFLARSFLSLFFLLRQVFLFLLTAFSNCSFSFCPTPRSDPLVLPPQCRSLLFSSPSSHHRLRSFSSYRHSGFSFGNKEFQRVTRPTKKSSATRCTCLTHPRTGA